MLRNERERGTAADELTTTLFANSRGLPKATALTCKILFNRITKCVDAYLFSDSPQQISNSRE